MAQTLMSKVIADVQAVLTDTPACWNTIGVPPGPIDSRFMNTPTLAAQGLLDMNAAADCGSTQHTIFGKQPATNNTAHSTTSDTSN